MACLRPWRVPAQGSSWRCSAIPKNCGSAPTCAGHGCLKDSSKPPVNEVLMRSWHIFAIVALLIAGVPLGGRLISRNSRSPATGIEQTATAGDLRVTLRIDDTTVGTRVIDVTVADAQGQPADVSDLRLRFSMREMDMGLSEVQAQPVDRGHFQARGQFFSMVGNWAVEAVLMGENLAPIQVPFTMAIAGPGEMSGPID